MRLIPFAEVVVAPPKTNCPPIYRAEVELAFPVSKVSPLKVEDAREEEMVAARVPADSVVEFKIWMVDEAEV